MEINLTTGEGLSKRLLFPDNQPHIQIGKFQWHEPVNVRCSLTSPKELLELAMVANAIEEHYLVANDLHIYYLMGARMDRKMEQGDSFDLKVIANIINSLGFARVFLYDPHSDVAPALIKHSIVITNEALVSYYNVIYAVDGVVLLIPDAGAAKKSTQYAKWLKIKKEVQATKHRNVADGSLTMFVPDPSQLEGEDVVIIDDICDGGYTFILAADAVLEDAKPKSMTLIVTHGIFSKGFAELDKRFDRIIVSNSYRQGYNSDKVQVIKW